MPRFHGVTRTKSPGADSADNRRANRSTLVKRQCTPRQAEGIASRAVKAMSPSITSLGRPPAPESSNLGNPSSKQIAARAMGGRKYQGWVRRAAHQRKAPNPPSPTNKLTADTSGKSIRLASLDSDSDVDELVPQDMPARRSTARAR